ncbi:hypothetical protein L1987_25859 [Smallanthus sonchifolius]|uniref:Uncharacterized protein n=1 Tax=Smallanthus sonchifolius TaxID=185202 RepID=A0ACB9IBC5_9ASTR|nr:hypothetical protein L1987_25859 [Smallanthus sonchifolius]
MGLKCKNYHYKEKLKVHPTLSSKAASLTRIGITWFWRFCPNFPIEAQNLFDHLNSINESPIGDPQRRFATLIVRKPSFVSCLENFGAIYPGFATTGRRPNNLKADLEIDTDLLLFGRIKRRRRSAASRRYTITRHRRKSVLSEALARESVQPFIVIEIRRVPVILWSCKDCENLTN